MRLLFRIIRSLWYPKCAKTALLSRRQLNVTAIRSQLSISQLPDLTRSYNKTSHWMMRLNPGFNYDAAHITRLFMQWVRIWSEQTSFTGFSSYNTSYKVHISRQICAAIFRGCYYCKGKIIQLSCAIKIIVDLYSLSGKTSCRQISWSDHTVLKLWYVSRQRCCKRFCEISERLENATRISRLRAFTRSCGNITVTS